jgi:hypothetical protein
MKQDAWENVKLMGDGKSFDFSQPIIEPPRVPISEVPQEEEKDNDET